MAQLDETLFRNPPAKYRGAPFWSWNNRLDVPQLLRQIDQFKQMGFGGFHIHSRTGLDTEYLGEEFMAAVVACTEKAAAEGMLAWLYDEDRWPSGFAGGLVTREERFRAKRLLWTTTPRPELTLLARYEVVLKDGRLAKYRRLKNSTKSSRGAKVWHAYLQTTEPDPWFNHQTNVDVMNAEAIRRFIEVTHGRYAAAVGKHFGTVVPAIFTDEPQFRKKMTFRRADEGRDLVMPFTTDFPQTYRHAYAHDLFDRLPELFWDLPDGEPALARWCYHDHTAERFAAAFGDQIARWCERHGIALTGHMLGEVNLFSQTRGHGESMRGMRSFHLPGIDILVDRMELTTAKQAQSLAHQSGRAGVTSELYGVTNWDFDFVGHKAQGDWQAAMGVTVRVPHLAWVSMAGEAKRDYPAPIGYQSPWWKEYRLIEDHFARINTVMSRGKPSVRIAVIHPIESYWLNFGPLQTNQAEMEGREQAFVNITSWLAFALVDFDYVSESVGPGRMKYDAVVVPAMRTMRSTTLRWLEQVRKSGGTVVFAGEIPPLVDARPSEQAKRFARRCKTIPFAKRETLEALEPFRDVAIRHEDGTPADSILHQMRIDGKERHLFCCNTDRQGGRHNVEIRLRGRWDAILRDTMAGESRPVHARSAGRETIIPWSLQPHDHLILTLAPRRRKSVVPLAPPTKWVEAGRLDGPVPVSLSEPNVLLLDQAKWRLNDGEWQGIEEILRLDNLVRGRLNLPPRGGRMAQPWADRDPASVLARLQLGFVIETEIDIDSPELALEHADCVDVELDRERVRRELTGWWVDEAIQTVRLPRIPVGRHELLLAIPFTRKTNVESCCLLGDFGVAVSCRSARITAPVRMLSFGDWTRQGLSFYGGNVTYHCALEGVGGTMVEVSKFRNPLLSVDLDGSPAGKIAFAPFQLDLGNLTGPHSLDITAFGNRVNTFGPVHNANTKLAWVGPDAWRSTGADWSYEYQLKPTGILAAPIVKTRSR